MELIALELPKGDLRELPVDGSTGDVLLALEEERESVPGGCGR